MKQRLYILLIALLSLATRAQAENITLELYDSQAWTDNIESVLQVLVNNKILTAEKDGKNIVFLKNGKKLFGVEVDKSNNKIIRVPPTVIPSIDSFGAVISGDRYRVNFSVVINSTTFPNTKFRTYVKSFDTETRLSPGRLTSSECNAVTEIDVSSQEIDDLRGVEYFTKLTKLTASQNLLTKLDVSQNTALTYLDCANNQLTKLDVTNNTKVIYLGINNNQLTDVDLSKNTALNYLDCFYNQLKELDLSNNKALGTVYCFKNQLSSLNVSGCTALSCLVCNENQLTELDVSKNKELNSLSIFSNKIRAAEMEVLVNGLPEVSGENEFYVYNGEGDGNEMTPAQVETAKKKGWNVKMSVDGSWIDFTGFVIVDELNFPDKNFRDYVTTNFDTEKSTPGRLTKAECENAKEIDVDNFFYPDKQIESLKGVEHFTKLTDLNCSSNKLTELDVSKNTALMSLKCTSNKLMELDLSKNTALEYLSCYGNQLKELDVSNNTKLTELYCNKNQLSSLDVSNNTALSVLGFSENQLTEIDLSKNAELKTLDCQNNLLTSLDVSNNTALGYLSISNNQLTTLDLSNNKMLGILDCFHNNIQGAGMSALVNNLPKNNIDATFYIYVAPESNLMTRIQAQIAIEKGWKPQKWSEISNKWVDYFGEVVAGDANGDGEVTADDVNVVCAYILGLLPDDQPFDEESADVSNDGTVDIVDVTRLIELVK